MKQKHLQYRHILLTLWVGLAAAAFSSAAAAYTFLPIQTEVLDSGSFDARVTGGISDYDGGLGSTADAIAGIRFGMQGPLDATLRVPYRYDLKTDDRGVRSSLIMGMAYQLFDRDEMRGTIQAYTTIAPNREYKGVNSGSNNLGVRVELINERWWQGGGIHVKGGWEQSDQRRSGEDPGPGSYRSSGLLTFEVGAEFDIDHPYASPYLGIGGTTGIEAESSNGQNSLSVRPGISFDLDKYSQIHAISQLDLLGNGGEPTSAIFISFTYGHRPAQAPTPTPSLSGAAGQQAGRLGSLEERLSEISSRVRNLEMRMLEKGEREPETAAVVVLNQSGIGELTPLVEQAVGSVDLTVTNSSNDNDAPTRDRTVIRYLQGNREDAVQLARALPGNQIVEERNELPDGADILLLIGFDLEQMLEQ